MVSGRVLMYNTNSIGPSTEPWGMPLSTSCHLGAVPFTRTLCLLPSKNCSIHFKVCPSIVYTVVSQFLYEASMGHLNTNYYK